MTEEKQVAAEYNELWKLANELVDEDIKSHPLKKTRFFFWIIEETREDRVEEHLANMMSLYRTRYGQYVEEEDD